LPGGHVSDKEIQHRASYGDDGVTIRSLIHSAGGNSI
jgi:hypothetical protein